MSGAKKIGKLYQPSAITGGVFLREMVPTDEPVFRQLYAQVRMPELVATGWPVSEKQLFCDSQFTLQDQHYRKFYTDFEAWAICRGGDVDDVIGRLYLATFSGDLVLMDITIEASQRGQGIGSKILADLTGQADQLNREMSLHVEPDNPARRLYTRFGFAEKNNSTESDIYFEMRRPATPI
jgi:ribosomal protein S18 acetylase RimI-like enzyme